MSGAPEKLVRDNLSPRATYVTLVLRNSHKKTVKTFCLGTRKVAAWYAVKRTPKAGGTQATRSQPRTMPATSRPRPPVPR